MSVPMSKPSSVSIYRGVAEIVDKVICRSRIVVMEPAIPCSE